VDEVVQQAGGRAGVTTGQLVEQLTSDAQHAYDQREAEVGEDLMRDVERRIVLQVLDRKWREHLYEMDYLKEGIGLRAMAQRDPLVEYRDGGHMLFQAMAESIKEESVGFLFNLEVRRPEQQAEGGEQATVESSDAEANTPAEPAAQKPAQKSGQKSGRRAGAKSAPARDALGLEIEQAPTKLNYSAPSLDGSSGSSSGGARQGTPAGVGAARGAGAASGGGNREERRRAAKAAKKQR